MNYLIPIIVVFFNNFFGAYAAFLLKKGTNKRLSAISHLGKSKYKYLGSGLLLYASSAVIFVSALKFAPLSVIFPVTSFTLVWSYFLASKHLGEKIGPLKLLGVFSIIFGILLIAFSS